MWKGVTCVGLCMARLAGPWYSWLGEEQEMKKMLEENGVMASGTVDKEMKRLPLA